jgi:protease II
LREYTKRLQRDTKRIYKEIAERYKENAENIKNVKEWKEWKSIWTMPLNPVAVSKDSAGPREILLRSVSMLFSSQQCQIVRQFNGGKQLNRGKIASEPWF